MLLEGEYRIIVSWSEYKRILQSTENLNFRGVATAQSKTSPVYITIEHRSTIRYPRVEAIFLVLCTLLNISFLLNASRIDLTCPKRLPVNFDSVLKVPVHYGWFNAISIASL